MTSALINAFCPDYAIFCRLFRSQVTNSSCGYRCLVSYLRRRTSVAMRDVAANHNTLYLWGIASA